MLIDDFEIYQLSIALDEHITRQEKGNKDGNNASNNRELNTYRRHVDRADDIVHSDEISGRRQQHARMED